MEQIKCLVYSWVVCRNETERRKNHLKLSRMFCEQFSRTWKFTKEYIKIMETLKSLRLVFKIIGLHSSKEKPAQDRLINLFVIGVIFVFFIITIEYICSHTDDTPDFVYAIMEMVTFVTIWLCYICLALQKSSVLVVFNKIQGIVRDYREYLCFASIKFYNLGK